MRERHTTLILGIGNLLWADEGFGVRAVEMLHSHYEFPENVTVMDGGTQGLYLLQHVQAADILVVFDAVDYGLKPGTMSLIEGDAVPRFLGTKKISLHQTGFQDVLATAEILGDYPTHLLLAGVQPLELEDYGGSLTPLIKAQIQVVIDVSLDWLLQFGIQAKSRKVPLSSEHTLTGAAFDIERYEQERPGKAEACRVGDPRVLKSPLYEVTPRPHPIKDSISIDVDHRGKY